MESSNESTQGLLKRASQGDGHAVDSLLEAHLPALLGYVRCRVDPVIRDRESCADIVQSICREVLEHQEGFEYRGLPQFRKWLFTKALAKLVERKRYYLAEKRSPRREFRISRFSTQSRIEGIYADLCSPSRAAIANEEMDRLERAFGRLPEDYQTVIHLSRFMGMSHTEIAQEMGRKPEATRVLLHRALARLGLLMHEDEQEARGG